MHTKSLFILLQISCFDRVLLLCCFGIVRTVQCYSLRYMTQDTYPSVNHKLGTWRFSHVIKKKKSSRLARYLNLNRQYVLTYIYLNWMLDAEPRPET